MRCERCGHADHRGLVLDADKKLVCHRCDERERDKRQRLDAAVKRRRVMRLDLTWCHPSDRRAVGNRLRRLAATTPDDGASILQAFAGALRSSRPIIDIDLTSVSPAAEREVAVVLDAYLEHEYVTAGPDRDILVTIVASWADWRRAA